MWQFAAFPLSQLSGLDVLGHHGGLWEIILSLFCAHFLIQGYQHMQDSDANVVPVDLKTQYVTAEHLFVVTNK